MTSDQHRAAQNRLAVSFGHDPRASDLSRVLRLPAFRHMKRPDAPHVVRLISGNRRRYNANEILAAFPAVERPSPGKWRPSSNEDERVRAALMSIPTELLDRWQWVRIGMALKAHFGDGGLALWDTWSRQSEHYERRGLERVWRSFRGSGLTIGTVYYYAKEYRRAA